MVPYGHHAETVMSSRLVHQNGSVSLLRVAVLCYGLYALPVAVHGGAGGGRGCHGLQAGGADYQWILALGQRAAAEVVLRAGSRCKKQDGCCGQYMQWKSVVHILSLLGMIYLKVCVHIAAVHRVPVADSG